jgi:RND superfamily putative drug exporter
MKRKEHTTAVAGKGAGITERLARAAATHPFRTIAVFVLLMAAALLGAATLMGTGITSEAKFRAGEPASVTGQRLVQDRLTGPQKMTDFVIVRSATLTVDDPAYKAYVDGLSAKIGALGPKVVEGAATYYQTKDPTLVSRDKHSTLIPVVMAGDQDKALENAAPLHEVVLHGGDPGFTLAQTGDASLNAMANELAKSDLERAEVFGMPVALVVLLLVFGAVLAAFMPLVLSIISIRIRQNRAPTTTTTKLCKRQRERARQRTCITDETMADGDEEIELSVSAVFSKRCV